MKGNAEFRKDADARGRWPEEEVWHPDPPRLDTSVVRYGRQINVFNAACGICDIDSP